MKKTLAFIFGAALALSFTGCLSTSSIFDWDDEELSDYYYNQIKSGTEEKLAEKQKSEDSSAKSESAKSSTAKSSAKAESTESKIERAKQLYKSDNLSDLETASSLVAEARKAEPWNVELGDLDYDIDEKIFAAKIKTAEKLLASGTEDDLDKASALVKEVLDKRPGNSDARSLSTKISSQKSKIKSEQVSIEMQLEDIKAYIKSNSPDLAIKRAEKLLASYPQNADAKKLMADAKTLQAKNLAMDKGYLDDAEKLVNEALKYQADNGDAKKLLSEIKSLKKKAENCPFKVGSSYVLTSYNLNGKPAPKNEWKPNQTIKFVSKSTMTDSFLSFSSEYGFNVDTASRKIYFNNTSTRNVLYTNATYSADLKTITLYGIDIDGNLDGYESVFTLK